MLFKALKLNNEIYFPLLYFLRHGCDLITRSIKNLKKIILKRYQNGVQIKMTYYEIISSPLVEIFK